MSKDTSHKKAPVKKESVEELTKESTKKEPVQKGYNEKNPGQQEGAFPADSKKDNKSS